jgi:hypothetical protein
MTMKPLWIVSDQSIAIVNRIEPSLRLMPVDMALFDGHVEKVPLENLWNYYWSRDWQIPNPRPH